MGLRFILILKTMYLQQLKGMQSFNSLSSASPPPSPPKNASDLVYFAENFAKIALLPIAPKFGTKEVNRFSQSPA